MRNGLRSIGDGRGVWPGFRLTLGSGLGTGVCRGGCVAAGAALLVSGVAGAVATGAEVADATAVSLALGDGVGRARLGAVEAEATCVATGGLLPGTDGVDLLRKVGLR